MQPIRTFALMVLLSCLTSCIPTTTATIQLGDGFSLVAMDRADAVLEKAGFTRMYYESNDGARLPRIEREAKTLSGFDRPAEAGFGASVVWRARDGALDVVFAERDTSFSERGKELLSSLLDALREEFGERVMVVQERIGS